MTTKRKPPAPKAIKIMFDHLAPFYDRVNTIISLGRDDVWRRLAVKQALGPGCKLALDVAAGTGRMSIALAKEYADVISIDLSAKIMVLGKEKLKDYMDVSKINFVLGDALLTPFKDNTFDCAVIGFATRNVADLRKCFAEMLRVVKPGGRIVCLELSRPKYHLINAPFQLYLRTIVPFLGNLFAGQPGAYRWLGQSLQGFPQADELKILMEQVGIKQAAYRRLQLGTVAIHWGIK